MLESSSVTPKSKYFFSSNIQYSMIVLSTYVYIIEGTKYNSPIISLFWYIVTPYNWSSALILLAAIVFLSINTKS